MNISLGNILVLRYQYEEIVRDNNFILPNYDGTINSLEWFIKNGHKKNGNNPFFREPLEIANTILGAEYAERKKQKV